MENVAVLLGGPAGISKMLFFANILVLEIKHVFLILEIAHDLEKNPSIFRVQWATKVMTPSTIRNTRKQGRKTLVSPLYVHFSDSPTLVLPVLEVEGTLRYALQVFCVLLVRVHGATNHLDS